MILQICIKSIYNQRIRSSSLDEIYKTRKEFKCPLNIRKFKRNRNNYN